MTQDIDVGKLAEQINDKADRDLWNTVPNVWNNTLNTSQITNCITEIPQDIKLELKDGVLTLKAGSKVYVPNGKNADGSNKFDEYITSQDIIDTDFGNNSREVAFLMTKNVKIAFSSWPNTLVVSGTSTPDFSGTGYWGVWYDTSNNIIKVQDGTNDWKISAGFSLPFCLVSSSSSAVTSIDQVFNGFGYIGSTVFALPGVKGLIPNGRNADGSLKNIEFTLDSVKTATRTWIDGDSRQVWGFCVNPPAGMAETWYWNNYEESETEPSYIDYVIWYKPSENITYVNNQGGSKNWVKVNYINFGKASGINSQEVKIFTTKTTFHALDYNNKSEISGWGMPSTRYLDLTLGASGATYTAPANGWFFCSSEGVVNLLLSNQEFSLTITGAAGYAPFGYMPVKKGERFMFSYSSNQNNKIRFFYAEGEN